MEGITGRLEERGMLNTQGFSSKGEMYNPFSAPMAGADLVNRLVTFTLCEVAETTPDPPTDSCHEIVFASQSIEPIILEMVRCTLQSFYIVMSLFMLLLCSIVHKRVS